MSGRRIVIVGAGPAGLAAAAAAARAGGDVLVFDERNEPGGQLLYRAQPIEAIAGEPARPPGQVLEALVVAARDAGAELRMGSLVAGVFAGLELLVIRDDGGQRVNADPLIVATGSTDLPYPFAGATCPGVFSARAVQIMLNQWRVRPGQRFAIVGVGPAADELAVDILLSGGEVAWSGIAPAPFLTVDGTGGARGLTVGDETVEVDVVAIAVGRQPDAALARLAGAPLGFSTALGGHVPLLDGLMQSQISGLFVAGDGAGAGSVATVIAEGTLAGVAAAASLGLAGPDDIAAALAAGGEELGWRIAERAGLRAVHVQPYE